MASVKLTNVKKIYGKNTVAVHDFNLDIADKEFIVFVGPSGCGKSTTLRMIAGLEDISGGTVEIDGVVVNDLQPKDRGIAMVFQNYALYPHLSVFENMAFSLRLQKVPVVVEDDKKPDEATAEEPAEATAEEPAEATTEAPAEATAEVPAEESAEAPAEANAEQPAEENAEEQPEKAVKEKPKKIKYVKLSNDEIYRRVTEAAEILGITEYLTRRPRELSGGQRQRVAIGRAMVRDSKVFLMDEPLSNLDAKLRNQMRAEIILLRKKINTTFIYVTHDQTEAMTLGDRIVIMKDGIIMQVGSPSQVFEMPDNLFVAEFIGAPKMNTIRTRLEKEGNKYFVYPFGVKMPVDGDKGAALKAKDVQSQEIILGVRPEHVTLSNSKNPYALPCQIRVNEMMGSELHLHVTTEEGGELIIRVPTVDIAPQQLAALVPGVRIFVTFRSKVMHFFNAENEWNLLSDAEPILDEAAKMGKDEEEEELKHLLDEQVAEKKEKPAETAVEEKAEAPAEEKKSKKAKGRKHEKE